MTPEEMRAERIREKRLAKFRFKCLIRKVIVNRFWLNEMENQKLGENVRRNVAIIVRRKGKKGILSLLDKTIMNTPVDNRTEEQQRKLVNIILSLNCFARYPPKVRSRLARVTYYQYFNSGRTIIKENHHANALYFVLDGELIVTKRRWSPSANAWINNQVGILGPGDMFGEVALLQNIKRTATYTTSVDTELVCVYADDFNIILKDTLQHQWDQIKTSLKRFEYFDLWTEEQIRECCILSKIQQYSPLEAIYSADMGSLNYVFFVLSGNCTILQCLKLKCVQQKNTKKTYILLDVEGSESASRKIIDKIEKAADEIILNQQNDNNNNGNNAIDNKSTLIDNGQIVSETLIHNATNIYDKNLNIPKLAIQDKNENIEHHFIEVGRFACGSVFGLGEQMVHRTIVADNYVQCLLIPRYWLFQKAQNLGNIWQRTKMYLDSSIPSREKLFDDFKCTNKWLKYRKKIIENFVKDHPRVNPTRFYDVPIICRIEEGMENI